MKVVLWLVMLLCCVCPSYATATFTYTMDVTFGFNQPWVSSMPLDSPGDSGLGLFTFSRSPTVNPNLATDSIFQSVTISGRAGGSGVNGRVQVSDRLDDQVTFNFQTPTLLTMTMLGFDNIVGSSTRDVSLFNADNQTGEFVSGGSGGLWLKLDGNFFAIPHWSVGNAASFTLIGTHTIDIFTDVEANAIVNDPYIAPTPEPSIGFMVAAVGLSVLGLYRFR